jgi:hypothetical protein
VFLSAGETGLQSDSAARAEDVTVLRKASLVEPGSQLRKLSDTRICELASKVSISMGCLPPLTQVETHFTSRQILLAADERRSTPIRKTFRLVLSALICVHRRLNRLCQVFRSMSAARAHSLSEARGLK